MRSRDPDLGRSASLVSYLAAALGIVAFLATFSAIANDNPSIGGVAGGIATVLAATVIWQAGTIDQLTEKVSMMTAELMEKDFEAKHSATANSVHSEDTSTDKPQEQDVSSDLVERIADSSTNDKSNFSDSETGLLGERYFVVTLESRVATARRHLRPLAVVLIKASQGATATAEPVDPSLCADVIKETLRDADTLCRLDNGNFALLLEDTPENGAIWTVERVRRKLSDQKQEAIVWAGIACYPANGFDGPEVLVRAQQALSSAREWQQDRTEVADS